MSSYRFLFRTLSGILTMAALLGGIIYSIWVWLPFGGAQGDVIFSGSLLTVIGIFAAWFSYRIYRSKRIDRRVRKAWVFIGLGCLSTGLAEFFWVVYAVFNLHPLPFLTDALYLLYYPLMLSGLLSFPFAPTNPREKMIFTLDMTLVLTTSLMYYWVFVLQPLQGFIERYPNGMYVFGFPIGDMLILASSVALLQRNIERVDRWTLYFLGFGALISAFTDSFFIHTQALGSVYDLSILNIFWIISALAIMLAASLQLSVRQATGEAPESTPISYRPVWRVVILYFAVVAGWVLVALSTYFGLEYGLDMEVALFGALLLVILVLIRQYLVMVENVRLYHEMERLAVTDSLTGIYNRHYFNGALRREVERANRYGTSLSLLLMDVDGFKQVNDTYGHLQGDEVLKIIAGVLGKNLRSSDILARFGGDEFAIILPATSLTGAQTVAVKMQAAVGEKIYAGQPLGVSVGVVVYQYGSTPEWMIDQADQDLYIHKAERIGY